MTFLETQQIFCAQKSFFFFFAEGEVKSGKEIATCKEFHKC